MVLLSCESIAERPFQFPLCKDRFRSEKKKQTLFFQGQQSKVAPLFQNLLVDYGFCFSLRGSGTYSTVGWRRTG